MTTLADRWEQLEAETPSRDPVDRRRAFMAGALAAALLIESGRAPEALIAECSQFGRVVGTPLESAT